MKKIRTVFFDYANHDMSGSVVMGIIGLAGLVLYAIGGIQAIAPLGRQYDESNKTHVIQNWQDKIPSSPVCAIFKERFKATGEFHTNTANGAFHNDMMKIWEEAKAAGCGT